MKKITIALLLFAMAAPAFSADNGVYAGINAGRSKTDGNIGATTLSKTDDTSYGATLGYQFDQNVGLEAQYVDLGNFESDAYTGKNDVSSLSLVLNLPLADTFSLYGKLGYANTRTGLSNTFLPVSGADRSDVTYGAGAEFDLSRDVGLRLEWDEYGAAIHDVLGNTQNFKISNWNLGAIFRF